MSDRTFTLKFVGDIADAKKSLSSIENNVEGFKSKTTSAFKAVAGAISAVAVIEFGKSVVSAASDTEQALGASASVFKEYTDEVQGFGKTTAENLGISEAQFNQLASTTGALMKNAGVPLDEVTDSTIDLTNRAADMAAMFGGDVSEAMEAINSGLKGELDPLEKFGVSLKASTVDAKAAALGYVDSEGKVTDYGRTMARVALIMEQTADAQGTAAREAGTVAGQTMRMKAQFTDLQADLGAKLLPILVQLAKYLRGIIGFVKDNQGWLIPLAAAIAGIAVAMKAWQMAQAAWTMATEVATAAQWAFNAAMAANPIGLIVIAITAVIAAIVLLYTKVEWFRDGVDAAIDGVVAAWNWLWDKIKAVFNWIKTNWPLVLAALTGPIGIAIALIVKNWRKIKEVFANVVDAIKSIWNGLMDFFRGTWDAINKALSGVAEVITYPFKVAVEVIGYLWKGVKDAFAGTWQFFNDVFHGVADVITWPFKVAADAIKWAWDGVKGLFTGMWNFISSALHGIADLITYPFKIAFEAIKWLWNSTIGGFGFTVPSWVPFGLGGKEFRIPEMARGGIVTRPTIALLGEAGPEAVVPLARGTGLPGGGSVTINVYALTANAEVGRKVYEALREYERLTGKVS